MSKEIVYKEFKIGDLFDVDSWIYGKDKKYKTRLKEPNENSIAVISGTTENNGVNYYTDDILDESEIYNDCLTMATRGISGTCFYQDQKFCLANNVLVMFMPGISKNAKLYLATAIQKLPYGDNYSHYPTKNSLKKDKILLPVDDNGEPDFSYMSSYIKELETSYIKELETYLRVTGLDDYILTEEEIAVLEEEKVFREFRIGDLFDVDNTWVYGHNKQYKTKSKEFVKGFIPVISGITINNGINYYTGDSLNPEECFSDCLTITTRGEYSGTVTYHDGIFCLANNILVMQMPGLTKNVKLYLATTISKLNYGGYSYYPTKDSLKEDHISLPVDDNGDPDYEYMEKYIRAIEKQTISQLYDQRTKQLNITKSLIEET